MRTDGSGEQQLFLDAAERGAKYLSGVRDRSVAPEARAVESLLKLGGPLGAKGMDGAAVLALLDEVGSPATVANSGGRYFGYVNGGALPAARAANVLSLAWDQNAAMRVMSPTAAALEESCSACPPRRASRS
jgi:hypothetical protein